MPRAYLLQRILLLNSNIRVQRHTVATGKLNRENWHRHTVGWKMVYNEWMEFWGSLIECGRYFLFGKLSANIPGKSGLLRGLKQVLLFKIDPKSLAEVSY